jgi:hypothetical protein
MHDHHGWLYAFRNRSEAVLEAEMALEAVTVDECFASNRQEQSPARVFEERNTSNF